MKEVVFTGTTCVVKKTKYMNNDNLALILIEKDGRADEVYAHITVNTDSPMPPNVAIIKDYSENEGMLKAISDAGLVSEIIGFAKLGYVQAPIAKLNLDEVENL